MAKFVRKYRTQEKKTYAQLTSEYTAEKKAKVTATEKEKREKRGFGKSRLRGLAGEKGLLGIY